MKHIVIIGAGYGGLRAVEHLSGKTAFSITLVDKNPYHYMQTEAYGYIAGRFNMSDIAIDLQGFTQGLGENVTFIQDEAIAIDRKTRQIGLKAQTLSYDYLIIAVGAKTNFFSFIEGAREHTNGVKNIQRAFEFRQAFEHRLYTKLQDSGDTLDHEGDLHIAIAGAGLSGVEIAAEMAFTLQRYHKILSEKSQNLEFSIIDAADTILPGMDPYIIQKTQERLDDLGVKIYTKAFIQKIEARSITFKDGSTLPFDFIIYTAGVKGADLVGTIDTPKNRLDQIIPDEKLRLQGSEEIFCIGDCTEIKDNTDKLLPPTAQIAEKSAAYVAKSIIRLEQGKQIQRFHAKVDGVFVALGGDYAAGVLFGRVRVKGYLAYVLKKIITRTYRFGLELKVNAGYKKRGDRTHQPLLCR